ncbi:MAG: hypothetical protein L6461_13585 [Anaerolineae bacterium]|nr:hypothetical protein [Anaerolineae bacterium]
MSQQAIRRIIIAVIIIFGTAFFCYYFDRLINFSSAVYYELFIRDRGYIPEPDSFGGYSEDRTHYFQFDPQTILVSLDQEKFGVSPISYDDFWTINDQDAYYVDVEWTQSDFLSVIDRLSQRVWNEPLDLDIWSVYSIDSYGNCSDNFVGFYWFDFVYYKTVMKRGLETVYTARHVRLDLLREIVWMGESDFSRDIFLGYWKKVELTKFRVTAEQAVQIAEERRKNTEMANDKNCGLDIRVDQRYERLWSIYYHNWLASLNIYIDPITGKIRSVK